MKLLFYFLIFLFSFSFVNAQPNIVGVSGSLVNGETITLTGNNFGIKSPVSPLLWDDFEHLQDGIYEIF